MDSAPLSFFGHLNHHDASCVCIPHSFISFDSCILFLLLCFYFAVAYVALALVFMPAGLFSTAYRAPSLA